MVEQKKEAILLVSVGTSYQEVRENVFLPIAKELYQVMSDQGRETFWYEAYTSSRILQKLRQKHCPKQYPKQHQKQYPKQYSSDFSQDNFSQNHFSQESFSSRETGQSCLIGTVEEALERALEDGVTRLYVIPTHMIPGIEYQKLAGILAAYQKKFDVLSLAPSILQREEDCARLVPILREILSIQPEREYILMGHGTEDAARIRYEQMNTAIWQAGFENVQIAAMEGEPGLEAAIRRLREREKAEEQTVKEQTIKEKSVVLFPFMIAAGSHVRKNMIGEEWSGRERSDGDTGKENLSYAARLRESGYEVTAVLRGLGEYPVFRQLYIERLRQML